MKSNRISYFLSLVILIFSTNLEAQKLIIHADDYQHQFEGAGVSIGLFMGHHYSMNEEGQAEAIRLINKDLNMKYLQDYIGIYPKDDPAYFDRRANYIKAAKELRPDIQVSMVGNIFPEDLRDTILVNGEALSVLDTDDPEIYRRLANWYFQLFKGFHDRGVEVDILNVVNEPDLDRVFRKYHYGLNGNTQEGVSMIFKQAVALFIEMLKDPTVNNSGMKVPLIMGPSTISPRGCLDYIDYFKSNHPEVWELIDIVATHQYIDGSNITLFRLIRNQLDGRAFHQSETHAFRGDNLGNLPIDKPLRTTLSLASLFGTAVTNGVEAWYYFENNYPGEYDPPGLIRVAWNAVRPIPYKHYYAFKQLTSAQPSFSHVIHRELKQLQKTEATTFRKMGEDTIYAHVSNYEGTEKTFTLEILEDKDKQNIESILIRTTDGTRDDVISYEIELEEPLIALPITLSPYSVNTLKIVLKNSTTSTTKIPDRKSIVVKQFDEAIVLENRGTDHWNQIYVYNIAGQVIFNISLIDNHSTVIHTADWPSGMYIVNILAGKKIYNQKFIIP